VRSLASPPAPDGRDRAGRVGGVLRCSDATSPGGPRTGLRPGARRAPDDSAQIDARDDARDRAPRSAAARRVERGPGARVGRCGAASERALDCGARVRSATRTTAGRGRRRGAGGDPEGSRARALLDPARRLCCAPPGQEPAAASTGQGRDEDLSQPRLLRDDGQRPVRHPCRRPAVGDRRQGARREDRRGRHGRRLDEPVP